ncbi:hypothetical protein [Kitasatospora cineracea]|uniref:Uncharacterized protein n=1 Tax=Kitasatospora cineracea TaxID=88074 RepID=A0A8G1UM75_9ACTN|nr:hypothetical protein [Kitasatospora cineracea]ROR46572.1 hypothetical protein EDD39_4854 [Kitasatospora cineracea]
MDAQARLLLLIDAFGKPGVEGRMKLAKLDFLLRYPDRFAALLAARAPGVAVGEDPWLTGAIEQRMIRYRYGPWDPAYYGLLGALVGKRLITTRQHGNVAVYAVTESGHGVASALSITDSWRAVRSRTQLLRRYFNFTGTSLKDLIYETFPDIAEADWGVRL